MKINKNKKAVAGPLVDFFGYILLILVFICFFFLFSLAKTNIKESMTSDFIDVQSHFMLINYLRTPIDNDTIADLIIKYCIEEPTDRYAELEIYLKAQNVIGPSTTTARIVCSEDKILYLRKPICKEPRSISIPSYISPIKIDYCPHVDNAEEAVHPSVIQTVTSPDGKTWQKRKLAGIDYYQELNTENLLTVDDYDKKYLSYTSSDEYTQKVEEFKQKILAGQEEIIAPNGNRWKKVNAESYCLIETKQIQLVSCESNIWAKEKVIETLGDVPVK